VARNRIIKASFWSDAKIGRLTFGAQLCFLGIVNFADDNGVISASPRKILGDVFENKDSVTLEDAKGFLDELERETLIVKFTADEKDWYCIKNFTKHQRISHPSYSTNPLPPQENITDTPETHQSDTGDTPATHQTNININKEHKLKQTTKNINNNSEQAGDVFQSTPEKILFDELKEILKCPDLPFTRSRYYKLREIRTSVGMNAEKCKTAARNAMRDQSKLAPRLQSYFSWDWLFKDTERVSTWANKTDDQLGFVRSVAKDLKAKAELMTQHFNSERGIT
jgi:hypothetical protein